MRRTLIAAALLVVSVRSAPSQALHLPLPDRVHFAMDEVLPRGDDPVDPRMVLHVESARRYPTLQYLIRAEFTRQDRVLVLKLVEVYNDSPYQQDAVGPAHHWTRLDLVAGSYDLAIQAGDSTDRYRLTITDSLITITGAPGRFSTPVPAARWRFPRHGMHVLCERGQYPVSACLELFAALEAAGIARLTYPPPARPPRYYAGDDTADEPDDRVRYYRYGDQQALERALAAARDATSRFADPMSHYGVRIRTSKDALYSCARGRCEAEPR
ncbi:MAG: hypothetical protein ACRET3_06940 [Burkholderiales bacterium]